MDFKLIKTHLQRFLFTDVNFVYLQKETFVVISLRFVELSFVKIPKLRTTLTENTITNNLIS